MTSDLLQRGKNIKLAIFDVDGVLTDGRLYFLEDGSEFKTFNTLDGQGIKMLRPPVCKQPLSVVERHRLWNAAHKTWGFLTCIRAARINWWFWTSFLANST